MNNPSSLSPVRAVDTPPEALLRILAAYRAVIDASSDLIFVKDINSIYWACNPAFAEFAGRPEIAQIGHSDFDFFTSEQAEFFRARDRVVLDANAPARNEEWVTYPDGRRVLLDTLKSPIRGEDGAVLGLIGVARDVTDERLRDRSYRTLIETSHDGYWKVGGDARLLEVNDAYVRLSGYAREELLAMRIFDLEAVEKPDETALHIERIRSRGSDIFETYHRRKDGSVWQVEVSASFSGEESGGMFVFLRDINERKREEKMAAARLRMGELAVKGSMDDLLQLALDTAELMTRSNIGFFHFVDPDQETLTLQTWSTNTLKNMCTAEGKGQHYPVSQAGIWADCVRERRPVLINDYAHALEKRGLPAGHAPITRVANVPVFSDAGEIVAVIGVGNKPTPYAEEDVSVLTSLGNMAMEMVGRRHDMDRLRLISSVFDATQDGIVMTDSNLAIMEVNRAFTRITGYTPAEVFGRDPRSLDSGSERTGLYEAIGRALHARGYWQGELRARNKGGKEFTFWLTLNAVRNLDKQVTNYLAVFADLSENKAADARVEYLSRTDALTGLPNRGNFEAQLRQVVVRARRRGKSVGLILVGLDRFKQVNESFGHGIGDEILRRAAERVQERLRQEDILGRLGGDEFAIIVEEVGRPDALGYVAQQLMESLARPFRIASGEVYVGASIGISVLPLDTPDAEGLLRNVDSALALAKSEGRGTYRFYTEALTSSARERMALHAQLRRALEAHEFEVFYQPQLELSDGRVSGVEALVRWRRADGTLVSPALFIPVAEETGLIEEIGAWVLRQACQDVQAWLADGVPPLTLAVNVSARQFHPEKLPALVKDVLATTGLPPHLLELEITESAVMARADEAIELLRQLKALGVLLAIDDFGTGYSSLAYLKRFPVDKLKIDQSFVRDIPDDTGDMAIAATIIAMARHMRLRVLAEGVETDAQRTFLRDSGCDEMQGYLFSRPVPVQECLQKILRAMPAATP